MDDLRVIQKLYEIPANTLRSLWQISLDDYAPERLRLWYILIRYVYKRALSPGDMQSLLAYMEFPQEDHIIRMNTLATRQHEGSPDRLASGPTANGGFEVNTGLARLPIRVETGGLSEQYTGSNGISMLPVTTTPISFNSEAAKRKPSVAYSEPKRLRHETASVFPLSAMAPQQASISCPSTTQGTQASEATVFESQGPFSWQSDLAPPKHDLSNESYM